MDDLWRGGVHSHPWHSVLLKYTLVPDESFTRGRGASPEGRPPCFKRSEVDVQSLLPARVPPPPRLFLQLDYKVGWKKLKEVFGMAGVVVRADILEDKDGKSRGIGTVTFEQAIEAVQAICILCLDWTKDLGLGSGVSGIELFSLPQEAD